MTMNLLVIIISLIVASVPLAENYSFVGDDIIAVTDDFFADNLIIMRSEHDIIDILFPLNGLNQDLYANHSVLFFVLSDLTLHVRRDGVVTKLLDNATVAAAAKDHTKHVYFGAKDGLYHYNADKNTAEKYGNMTDSIVGIQKVSNDDMMYVLTEDYTLYKVTSGGTKKEKIEKPKNVRDIVLDIHNNLFLHTTDKTVHILNRGGVSKVEGLAKNPTYLKMFKGPFFVNDAIAIIANNMSHLVFANGTVGDGHCEYFVKPTAYSLQPLLIQHYGYKRNIYELNFLRREVQVTTPSPYAVTPGGANSLPLPPHFVPLSFPPKLSSFVAHKTHSIDNYSELFKHFLID